MIENNQAEKLQENEDLEIEIVDDPPEGEAVKSAAKMSWKITPSLSAKELTSSTPRINRRKSELHS